MTRHIAHITIETKTPLKIGSNANDFVQDAPVLKDFNNLPMIAGTSIAGVLRKEYKGDKESLFGGVDGSRIIISNALLLDEDRKVNESLLLQKSQFLKLFDGLVMREHTAINEKGVAKEHSKFDEEVVFVGSRFRFSIESIDDEKENFFALLNLLQENSFRLGGGSTKGFGALKVIKITYDEMDLEKYTDYVSSLNTKLSKRYELKALQNNNYINYTLKLKPDDFFLFGSGFGDDEADMTPRYEVVIDYDKKGFAAKKLLIPASSIKGALSHRTTYHYNKLVGNTIEAGNGVGSVVTLFGEAKESEKSLGKKGKLLLNDCYVEDFDTKVFDHVSIDRFTGGAIEGALFQEKTATTKQEFSLEILLKRDIEKDVLIAFESSLKDITTGMLLLGGGVTKGHGVFSGQVFKDGGAL